MITVYFLLVLFGCYGIVFYKGVNFRILRSNYLDKGMDGGIRFGIGYNVPVTELNVSDVWFRKWNREAYDFHFINGILFLNFLVAQNIPNIYQCVHSSHLLR